MIFLRTLTKFMINNYKYCNTYICGYDCEDCDILKKVSSAQNTPTIVHFPIYA